MIEHVILTYLFTSDSHSVFDYSERLLETKLLGRIKWVSRLVDCLSVVRNFGQLFGVCKVLYK